MNKDLIVMRLADMMLNREMERRWRAGLITWEAFDWWLRWICGV